MADGGQSGIPARNAGHVAEAPGAKRILASARPLRARDVQLYLACEDLTEPLIYLLVVFGPNPPQTPCLWPPPTPLGPPTG